jgi:hypothetical protein
MPASTSACARARHARARQRATRRRRARPERRSWSAQARRSSTCHTPYPAPRHAAAGGSSCWGEGWRLQGLWPLGCDCSKRSGFTMPGPQSNRPGLVTRLQHEQLKSRPSGTVWQVRKPPRLRLLQSRLGRQAQGDTACRLCVCISAVHGCPRHEAARCLNELCVAGQVAQRTQTPERKQGAGGPPGASVAAGGVPHQQVLPQLVRAHPAHHRQHHAQPVQPAVGLPPRGQPAGTPPGHAGCEAQPLPRRAAAAARPWLM